MPRSRQQLIVWMNGLAVGRWSQSRAGDRFEYFTDWISDPQGRPLSLSLPFTPGNQPYVGQVVTSYFDNLLPDNENIRRRLAQRYQTDGLEPFQLLAGAGRDCVGAIQLLPPDEEPLDLFQIRGEPLDEALLAQLLRNTVTSAALAGPMDEAADLRLSIAGAQEKTALLWHEGQWRLPKGSTPTTHILKLPLGLVGNVQADMRTSVENEWLCSKIVAAFGLPVARCDIARFEDQKVLVVERFDRRLDDEGDWIMRLPQEDMCQATGTPPFRKYQSEGGPGIEQIMTILLGSERAAIDRAHFFKAQLLFWLLSATDGHAKNYSIRHLSGGRYEATPLYDVLSMYPIMRSGARHYSRQKAKLAMAVRGRSGLHYLVEKIMPCHWQEQAQRVGLSKNTVEVMTEELFGGVERVIETVSAALPADFPLDVSESIFEGMLKQRDCWLHLCKHASDPPCAEN